MKNFRIVSYYTLGTPYVEVANKFLIPSLSNFPQIKRDINGVPNLGSWAANTSYKAIFIKKMLEKYPGENIVYLDSDAEVLVYPKLFEEIPEEYLFGCHILDRNTWYKRDFGDSRYELLSGTLFIRNCNESKEIVNKWIEENTLFPRIWEQRLLDKILKREDIKVYQLPIEYCYILTLPDGNKPHVVCNPVIQHNQVGRELKHIIK